MLHHAKVTGDNYIRLLVTLSTPWGGHASAQKGVENSPVVIDSWIDVSPDSDYIRNLFYQDPESRAQPRGLPDQLSYHPLFGFRRSGLSGPSGDGVVSVASQLAPIAQCDADSIFGLDEDHTIILRSEATVRRLNAILERAAR